MSTPRAIRLILVPVDMVFFIVQIAREGTIGRLSNKPARDCQKDWVDFLPKKKTDFTNHENGVLQNGTSRFDLTGGNYNKLRFRCSAVPLFRCSAVPLFRCCKTARIATPRAAQAIAISEFLRNTACSIAGVKFVL